MYMYLIEKIFRISTLHSSIFSYHPPTGSTVSLNSTLSHLEAIVTLDATMIQKCRKFMEVLHIFCCQIVSLK